MPPPKTAPGAICIFTTIVSKSKTTKDQNNIYNFSLNGAPGKLINGRCKQMFILYPYSENIFFSRKKAKNIDFSGVRKIKSNIDNILSKFKTTILKKYCLRKRRRR